MATQFDRETFAASPFMRALTGADVLSATERKEAARAEQRNNKDLRWRCWTEYRIFFHRAASLSMEGLLARHNTPSWHPGHPETVDVERRHDEAVNQLYAVLNRWAALAMPTKLSRARFLAAVKESGEAISGPTQWSWWKLAMERWEALCRVQGEV